MTFIQCNSETEQEALGAQLATACKHGMVIYLLGELGAGKTTFARGFVHGLGHQGRVKSPTYTLVEEYATPQGHCYHFDLYRLADPEELEYMGIRDFAIDADKLLIEWPDKGQGFLPAADLIIKISYLNEGRQIDLKALTDRGNHLLKQIDR